MSKTDHDDDIRRTIQSLFQGLPADFDQAASRAADIAYIFRSEMATRLEPTINQYLQRLHDCPLEEQIERVARLQHALRSLRLAIRSPTFHVPAKLEVAPKRKGSHEAIYRLQTLVRGRLLRDWAGDEPPTVNLMPDVSTRVNESRIHRHGDEDTRSR